MGLSLSREGMHMALVAVVENAASEDEPSIAPAEHPPFRSRQFVIES